MGIDFASLVLGPNQAAFAIPVTVDPVASQPGCAPYPARGIYTSRPVEVILDNGLIVSDQRTTLDIWLEDVRDDGGPVYAVPPHELDMIIIDRANLVMPPPGRDPRLAFQVFNTNVDGYGVMILSLRLQKPEPVID